MPKDLKEVCTCGVEAPNRGGGSTKESILAFMRDPENSAFSMEHHKHGHMKSFWLSNGHWIKTGECL